MISAIVLTRNEEKNIENCLKSLSWCDEVIVIDDKSSDNTAKISQKLGAQVYIKDLSNDFASQRNFGLSKAKGDWILFLDADEIVTDVLRGEIQQSIIDSKYNGFLIRRVDSWKGRLISHGEVGKTQLLRLAKKDMGSWERRVHEIWNVESPIGTLKHPLIHYPHPTVEEFVSEIERYSTLHAEEKFKNKERATLFKVICYPIIKFKVNYILRLGFLDGTQGFIYAALMSFHSYLSWSKLWILQKKALENK